MRQSNKKIFYEVNPRYFKDGNGDGVGDFQGLATKLDYFKFLNVDALILQDVLSTDVSATKQSFKEIASELGDIEDFKKVIEKAKKYDVKIFIELKLGSISKNNEWFIESEKGKIDELRNVVEFVEVGPEIRSGLEYVKSDVNDNYYVFDVKTQEVPLNWSSQHIINQYMSVITFWRELGVLGFVFKDFEYVNDKEKSTIMSQRTIDVLSKFAETVRNFDDSLVLIGKSDLISISDNHLYTEGSRRIFDKFLSTNISLLGTDAKLGNDKIGKFSQRHLGKSIKIIAKQEDSILSFGSRLSGRIISRWGSEQVFHKESAKGLALLLLLVKNTSSIYYGDEIGSTNIGLNQFSDYQDRFIEERKFVARSNHISSEKFYEAQSFQNPINSRSIFAWNAEENAGFSTNSQTITPISNNFKDINVTKEFTEKESVLNFYKKLFLLLNDPIAQDIIENGRQTVTNNLFGVTKIAFKYGRKQLVVAVNLSDSSKPILKNVKDGVVLLSTYFGKKYTAQPKTLEAYEGVVISNIYKYSGSISKKVDKIEVEGSSNQEVNRNEDTMWFKRKEVKSEESKVSLETPINKDDALKSTLEIEKEKAIAEREADRSHKDEQTNLTEDELAKTTLIDDSMDIEELFRHEDNKKKKD